MSPHDCVGFVFTLFCVKKTWVFFIDSKMENLTVLTVTLTGDCSKCILFFSSFDCAKQIFVHKWKWERSIDTVFITFQSGKQVISSVPVARNNLILGFGSAVSSLLHLSSFSLLPSMHVAQLKKNKDQNQNQNHPKTKIPSEKKTLNLFTCVTACFSFSYFSTV